MEEKERNRIETLLDVISILTAQLNEYTCLVTYLRKRINELEEKHG